MQNFKKLRVWHLAHRLSVEVIEALSGRTVRRVPGLRSQAVRALARDTRVLTEVVHASLAERLNLTRRMLISLMRVLERQIAEEENRTRRKTG